MQTETATLLVVEDHPATGELLAGWLRGWGYTVTVCSDGRKALEAVRAGCFDLVLLDVGVPGADGFQVLRALRAGHSATALPVVMATAFDQSEMIVKALELGANDYVTKPFDLPVLLARVQTQLSLKRLVEQRARLEQSLAERNGQLERANLQLSEANQRMKAGLDAAARVQETLLPPAAPKLPGLSVAWSFRPCEELAGDTLNVFALDDDFVGFYLLDVCGHGVPAALFSVHLSLLLAPPGSHASLVDGGGGAVGRPLGPAEVVAALNRHFEGNATERFFTLFYGLLNVRSGELRYVCAGHPGPAHLCRRECTLLPPSGPPIGLMSTDYEEGVLRLLPGDRLYMYSDGVTEAAPAGGPLYGKDRLIEVLLRQRELPLEESLTALLGEVQAWCGGNVEDDVSVLALELAPGR
jgi:sigma-B regulation protein RsbU (phosphoserine phosphatase)